MVTKGDKVMASSTEEVYDVLEVHTSPHRPCMHQMSQRRAAKREMLLTCVQLSAAWHSPQMYLSCTEMGKLMSVWFGIRFGQCDAGR